MGNLQKSSFESACRSVPSHKTIFWLLHFWCNVLWQRQICKTKLGFAVGCKTKLRFVAVANLWVAYGVRIRLTDGARIRLTGDIWIRLTGDVRIRLTGDVRIRLTGDLWIRLADGVRIGLTGSVMIRRTQQWQQRGVTGWVPRLCRSGLSKTAPAINQL